jgi:hypothetical protein
MAVVCKHLAGPAPNTIVGVLVETLQHPHNFLTIESRRPIAEYMDRHETHPRIGVGGHLQKAIPDFRNLGFHFAWAESPECFAALPRVKTVSEFKPVRDITPASSHATTKWLSFATETAPAVSSPICRPQTEYRVRSRGDRLEPKPVAFAPPSPASAAKFAQ